MATLATVGGKITAALFNELVLAVNLMGSQSVAPTSVAGTGVSVDPASGVVTFSAASSVTVNGCFTADFANYELDWDIPTTSSNNNLTFQLRASGSTATTAYDRLTNGGTGAVSTSTVANNLNQASWQVAAATTAQHFSVLRLFRPFVAVPTDGILTGNGTTNPPTAATTFAIQQSHVYHRTATAYHGFVLTASTGTITGTLRIKGLR